MQFILSPRHPAQGRQEKMDQTFMKALRKKFTKKRHDRAPENEKSAKQDRDYSRLFDDLIHDDVMGEHFIRLQNKVAPDGGSCTYIAHAEVNPNLQHRADMVRLRDELMVQTQCTVRAGEELSRLKSKLAEEEESCLYFAKINSELEIRVETSEANFKKEKENGLRQGEDLIRLQRNLNAEEESCAYFMKDSKDLETKIEELESALLNAQTDLKDEKEKFLCQICLERPRNALCVPCRHFHYCISCLESHQRVSKTCPTCRVSTTDIIECYT